MASPTMTKKEFQEYHSLKRGETVYTILRHVSRSGMQRVIELVIIRKGKPIRIGWSAAKLIGSSYDQDHGGIKTDGCGMDMGFNLVHYLSSVLWPKGFKCIGEHCPSNDHSNYRQGEAPTHHKSGGYALTHNWL